jgi:hypothetical protein
MSADEQQPAGPARTYQDLRVVADLLERDEHLTIGVIYEGAFVPIAVQPLGFIEQFKTRWNGLGGIAVDSQTEARVQVLEDRIAGLERDVIAAAAAAKAAAKPPSKPATK